MNWIVCQIGGREHYAVPRALLREGQLAALVTDFWVPPGAGFSRLPGGRRLRDRFHGELSGATVLAPNFRMLAFELEQRLRRRAGWPVVLERNRVFQNRALRYLERIDGQRPASLGRGTENHRNTGHRPPSTGAPITLFSYSYAALELFRYAKERGWTTVLGQIDPGPEEERIVGAERERYRHLTSSWRPAPASYWEGWRGEVALADRIIVNSEWSRQCLLKEDVPAEKMEVVPLVYGEKTEDPKTQDGRQEGWRGAKRSAGTDHTISRFGGEGRANERGMRDPEPSAPFRVLFLGQVNLRKGVGRLLDAMRLVRDEPIELTLAGPAQVEPSAWADLPKVRWIGAVPRSEVGRHYMDADLFILPTLSDGYALTQLEAMGHGLPVMASKCCGGAVRDGVNGVILGDLEPETIASALRRARTMKFPDVRPPRFGLGELAERLCHGDQ